MRDLKLEANQSSIFPWPEDFIPYKAQVISIHPVYDSSQKTPQTVPRIQCTDVFFLLDGTLYWKRVNIS